MRVWLLGAALLGLCGCSPFASLPSGDGARLPVAQRRGVQLFEAGPPKRPFAEAGPLEAAAGPAGDPFGELLRAAEGQGCDGVVVGPRKESRVTGTCVLFTDGSN